MAAWRALTSPRRCGYHGLTDALAPSARTRRTTASFDCPKCSKQKRWSKRACSMSLPHASRVPALPLRVSSRIGVAIAGRARGVGHHLSPARSAVAREAGAPGSSAVRRLPGGATLRVSVVSQLLLPGLP